MFFVCFLSVSLDLRSILCCVSQLWFLLFLSSPSIVWMNHEAAVHTGKVFRQRGI